MSKLTDKIEALIDVLTLEKHTPEEKALARSILADVRELEDGIAEMQLDAYGDGRRDAIRAAKREAYEHAWRIANNAGADSTALDIQETIDALDKEEGT